MDNITHEVRLAHWAEIVKQCQNRPVFGNRVLLTIYEHLFVRLDKQWESGIAGLRVMEIY
ncbi:hypothetical protein [Butyrivibrio sp. WCD3002]|uniref:hypothetical protein n=1 Tax=Butyrivibrio sp. WCD3002 TaxID=1280676 RepID=UPI00047B6FD7|nr:hypothetical protein [Butyrivibrio sp. WCD3002]